MADIDFCPYCSASAHKMIPCTDRVLYCKSCHKFFEFAPKKMHCPKCDGIKIEESDFPMASGEPVFQCKKCKKMFGYKEFLKYNKLLPKEE